MEQVKKWLEERREVLIQVKKSKEKDMESAPEGSLRICMNGNRRQFYHRTDPKDFSGVYIKEKESRLIQRLAQKDYDKRVLRSVEKEMKAIDGYLKTMPDITAEDIYETLHIVRQGLVFPLQETDEQYVRRWCGLEYEGKKFREDTPELYTAKEERVRSKSEIIIADLLNKKDVPYRYECPLYLRGIGTIYPDFTVLNIRLRKEFYWEHLGMMDNPDYVEHALQKIYTYEQNGIFVGDRLILSYETMANPIKQKQINEIIEHYLK